jgi:predicted dehydrogenase
MVTGERIRLGVVGLGLIAQGVHLPNLQTLRRHFAITHVCDVSIVLAATVADELPGTVRSSSDWHDVVADPNVDAVLALTPGSHGDLALAALRAGKHVLSEKPLAYSVAEALECDAAASAAGRVLQVGYMKMYDPAVRRARDELSHLGDLRVVRVTVLHPTDECQFDHVRLHPAPAPDQVLINRSAAYTASRIDEALGEGAPGLRLLYQNVLLGSVIHELSLLRALGLGLPERFDFVSVDPPLTDADPEGPPRILAVGRLPGGAQLQLSWTWVPDYPEYTEELAVFGSAGRLFVDLAGPYLADHRSRLRVQRMDDGQRQDAEYLSNHTTAFVLELEAFAVAVRHGGRPVADAAGAAEDVAALQRMLSSAGARQGLQVAGEAGRGDDAELGARGTAAMS